MFWTYVVTAAAAAVEDVGASALAAAGVVPAGHGGGPRRPAQRPGRLTTDLLLVLDDYHLVEAADVHEGMTFLLEHQPPQLHVVLATRTDPPLPLARMRARGQLSEVRAADLRFTVEESAAYLNEAWGSGSARAT